MKRKTLEASLVSTIEDIKAVESIDELVISNDDELLEISDRHFDRDSIDELIISKKDDELLEISNCHLNQDSLIDVQLQDSNNDMAVNTILEFLTSEDGELEIQKKKKFLNFF